MAYTVKSKCDQSTQTDEKISKTKEAFNKFKGWFKKKPKAAAAPVIPYTDESNQVASAGGEGEHANADQMVSQVAAAIVSQSNQTDFHDVFVSQSTQTDVTDVVVSQSTRTDVPDVVVSQSTQTDVTDVVVSQSTQTDVPGVVVSQSTQTDVTDVVVSQSTQTDVPDDVVVSQSTQIDLAQIDDELVSLRNQNETLLELKKESDIMIATIPTLLKTIQSKIDIILEITSLDCICKLPWDVNELCNDV